jgi:hypothetical protein
MRRLVPVLAAIGVATITPGLAHARTSSSCPTSPNQRGVNLSRADLHGCDLAGFDFTNANLNRAILIGARLDRAKFSGANLNQADLSNASAVGAVFNGSNLNRAALSGANLTGASFTGANTGSVSCSGTNVYGAVGLPSCPGSFAATVPGAPSNVVATAGIEQATVTFASPATDGGAAITSYAATSSPGSITVTGTSSPLTVTGLTGGVSYTFTVRATNAIGAGAVSAPSNAVVPQSVDHTPPTVSVSAPGGPSAGTVTLLADAADNVGVAGVTFTVDGVDVGPEVGSAPYSLALDTRTLADGAHAVRGRARDAAGNVGVSAPVTLLVDNTPPSVTMVSASIHQLTAIASDASGPPTVQFFVNGFDDPVGPPITGPPYTLTWPGAPRIDYGAFARATDAAGNVSFAGLDATDTGPGADVSDGAETGGAPVVIPAGTAVEGARSIFVDGGADILTGSVYLDAGTTASSVVVGLYLQEDQGELLVGLRRIDSPRIGWNSVELTPPARLGVGGFDVPFDVAVLGVGGDLVLDTVAGLPSSRSASSSLTTLPAAWATDGPSTDGYAMFVGVGHPPTVAILSPVAGQTVSGIVPVSIAADDDVLLERVSLWLDGPGIPLGNVPAPFSGPWTYSWDTRGLSNGVHTLQAEAVDDAGQIAKSETLTVIVDN